MGGEPPAFDMVNVCECACQRAINKVTYRPSTLRCMRASLSAFSRSAGTAAPRRKGAHDGR